MVDSAIRARCLRRSLDALGSLSAMRPASPLTPWVNRDRRALPGGSRPTSFTSAATGQPLPGVRTCARER
ncbi:hypothetical protein SR39_13030 [Methylobacterium radiotolerans]|nr:hypothetical protein SR39_13030 [Methylobacterium radiotolerans]